MRQLALFDAAARPQDLGVDEYGMLIPSTTKAPGQKFVPGDRVVTHWGRATVLAVYERPYFSSARSYHVRHDWSSAPPGFGHHFGENECQAASPEPAYDEKDAA